MLKHFIYKKYIAYKRYRFRELRKKEGTYISKQAKGYDKVTFEGENGIPEQCTFSGNIAIGKYTTLGVNNFLHGDISIGNYCQLGINVAIHTTNHPVHYMSIYINKRLFNGELAQLKQTKKTIIMNDVWIGHGAIILAGVTIGNGAIIAAGSVVSKDVAPYAIVGGVPAKIIKYRFSKEIIKEIEDLKWWGFSKEKLVTVKPLFFKNFKNKESIYN
jgi:acetyltransferase-like isoleucine patch superfamily enzyme